MHAPPNSVVSGEPKLQLGKKVAGVRVVGSAAKGPKLRYEQRNGVMVEIPVTV
jgi:hypothetical protein